MGFITEPGSNMLSTKFRFNLEISSGCILFTSALLELAIAIICPSFDLTTLAIISTAPNFSLYTSSKSSNFFCKNIFILVCIFLPSILGVFLEKESKIT